MERFAAHVADARARTRGLSSARALLARRTRARSCRRRQAAAPSTTSGRSSCRGMNSLDAGECEKRLRDPAARAAFLAERSGRPIRSWSRSAPFHAVSAGIQLGAVRAVRPGHAAARPDRGPRPPAQRAGGDPRRLDRAAARPSNRRAAATRPTPRTARCWIVGRSPDPLPLGEGGDPVPSPGERAGGRAAYPAAVSFVTSPGLVMPPDEPVPSN